MTRRVRAADLLVLSGLALVLRLLHLGRPAGQVFDESFYAQDACTYVHHSRALCGGYVEATFMHPPLGKWLIAWGIDVFGYDATGWRAAAVVTGVLTVAVTMALAALVLGRLGTVVTGVVLALDPLHIVFSRTATLDAPVTLFSTLAVLLAVLDAGATTARARRWWRPLTGLALGAAVATKWSGLLVLPVVALVVVAGARRRAAQARTSGETKGRSPRAALSVVLCGLVLPAAIYVASYAGRLRFSGAPWRYAGFARVLLRRQESMARYHLGLSADLGTHPYASPAWSWPLAKRPPVVAFDVAGDVVRETLGLVDPLLTVPALLLAVLAAALAVRRRSLQGPEVVVAAGALLTWLPWVVLSAGRPFVFAYYLLPTIPFLALALGWGVDRLAARGRRGGLVAAAAVLGVSVSFLSWFWPVLTSQPLSYGDWRGRLVADGCGGQVPHLADGRVGPRPGGGAPPPGWCWL